MLIFIQFVTTLERWAQELEKRGIETYAIHGTVTRKRREDSLSTFQSPQVRGQGRVLIMALKTGGAGLHLTVASYVIHAEPWWNPAAENQATDRAHRMGQACSVQVYRRVMQDTVEEKIKLLKAKKSASFDAVINGVSSTSDTSELAHTENPKVSATLQQPGLRALFRRTLTCYYLKYRSRTWG